jgi:hypothetical protein
MAKDSPADQFSDPEMEQIKHFGQMLGGQPTDFDEEVEKALQKRGAEASAKKMRAAQMGLAPSAMDTAAIKQREALAQQATTQGATQAQQAQGAQAPVNAPRAPTGPVGTSEPYPAQAGAVGPQETPETPASAGSAPPPSAPPAAPGPSEAPPD